MAAASAATPSEAFRNIAATSVAIAASFAAVEQSVAITAPSIVVDELSITAFAPTGSGLPHAASSLARAMLLGAIAVVSATIVASMST